MKLTNDCKNIFIDNSEFKEYFEQVNVDSIEILAQYNCCENLEISSQANLKNKVIPIAISSSLCVNPLEYHLKFTQKNSIEISESAFIFDGADFCCSDFNFVKSDLTEEEILNGLVLDSFATYSIYYIQRGEHIANDELYGASETDDVFNIGSDFEEQRQLLESIVGSVEFGGVKSFEDLPTEEGEYYAKEFGTFNGKSLLGYFYEFFIDSGLSGINAKHFLEPIYRNGLFIVCVEKCGSKRVIIGGKAKVFNLLETVGDDIFLDSNLTAIDSEIYESLSSRLTVTYSLINNLEFITTDITEGIEFDISNDSLEIRELIYIDETTFKVIFNVLETTSENTVIKLFIHSEILNTNDNTSYTVIHFDEFLQHIETTYLPNFNSDFIQSLENSVSVNFGLFENTMLDSLIDGIYRITVIIHLVNGTTIIWYNCIFVNCTTPCLLAEFMVDNIGTDIATELAMIHHSLVQADNCPCICDDMCESFEYLWTHLSNTQIPSGCEC